MSNVEVNPPEVDCGGEAATRHISVIEPRDVPLGGPRAMQVRRTLPTRERSMIGAWCFLDHYGPDDVATTGGMVVPPHPHTGLQTVSWLFTGEVEHRDSVGTWAYVRPGELNLMTAGRGISHSEVSTSETNTLHGVQLWLALPGEAREIEPRFDHFAPEPVTVGQASVSVFLGELSVSAAGGSPDSSGGSDSAPVTASSPVATHSPLLGAEVRIPAGAALELHTRSDFEHGILADKGEVWVGEQRLAPSSLGYVAAGPERLRVQAGETDARIILLGGEPFGEQIVMWWNFIGRDHDEIVAYRTRWQDEVEGRADPEQFGRFDYPGDSLPAPELPGVRLRPRGEPRK